ncbi:MAG: endopeptidase La, partial [Mycoplasma sp.]|nr:endopeptidase La [Mycoplasma sp.]
MNSEAVNKKNTSKRYPIIYGKQTIIFPEFTQKITIGRLESLEALKAAKKDKLIVIIYSNESNVRPPYNVKDLQPIGLLAKYKVIDEKANGAKDVEFYGMHRFELKEITWDEKAKTYFVSGERAKDIIEDPALLEKQIKKLNEKVINILKNITAIPNEIKKELFNLKDYSKVCDIYSSFLPLSSSQKGPILNELNINKRVEIITKYLSSLEVNDIDDGIDKTVKKTLDNQQKEFLLRERMKAIKEELGELSSKDQEIENWKKEVEKEKYPKEVKEKVLSEIKKYESMSQMAAESHIIKNYIEWILDLPWNTYTIDNNDIEKAEEILEKNHYGLKKVKERIIEHIAVRINTNATNSPILALVGHPGVGKTSLAKSIGDAIGRPVIKISLGGLRDESEIRGHRRTYVGAMPGKIISALKKAKSSNPVILLDEIDKMSYDFKGDPTSALLEVLDPEQNKKFQDHYIELEYDLSQVTFIATANYYDNIPQPLIDRVEIIHLSQYTSEEKKAIAKLHIIPNIIKEFNLKKSEFVFSDKIIDFLIDKYTMEAGVRELNRILTQLARKIVLKKLKKQLKSDFKFSEDTIHDLLGKEKVYKEKLTGKAEIGLVNGMYYSAVGGGVLPIEVTNYASPKGELKLTGSIKEVMKESLTAAIGYIRANAKEFNIDFDFESNSIQVHVPEGAVPKDGPSAGIAFATAIVSSLLNKPVPKEIALTGEITLRGKVLPIGGL